MGRYDDIAAIVGSRELGGQLTPLQESAIVSMRMEYPQIPEDYLDYLRQIGWGALGDNSYMIYSGLLSADEIYDSDASKTLSQVLFFGDDLQGYCAGFDVSGGGQIVEVDPTGMSIHEIEKSFESFIRDLIFDHSGAV